MSATINLKELNAKQRQAIRTLFATKYNEGESQAKIARDLRIPPVTVHRWVKSLEKANGDVGELKEKPRGRTPGETGKLNEQQRKDVQRIIIDKTPDQLQFKRVK